jgi:hypothetical protein
VVVRVEFEAIGLEDPMIADEFVRCLAFQVFSRRAALQAFPIRQ